MIGSQSALPTIPPAEERAETTDCNQLSAADAANLRTYHPPGGPAGGLGAAAGFQRTMRSASLRSPPFCLTSANHNGSRASTVAVAVASPT